MSDLEVFLQPFRLIYHQRTFFQLNSQHFSSPINSLFKFWNSSYSQSRRQLIYPYLQRLFLLKQINQLLEDKFYQTLQKNLDQLNKLRKRMQKKRKKKKKKKMMTTKQKEKHKKIRNKMEMQKVEKKINQLNQKNYFYSIIYHR